MKPETRSTKHETRNCSAPLEARLPHFVGARADAARALRDLKVAIVGVGSVGRNIALHLARFAGTLWLVDRGRLKAESLLTHPMVGPDDIGQPKASNLAAALRRCGFRGRVFAHDGPIEDLSLVAFADADLVVLATDNLAAEVEVGQRCLTLGLRLVHAAVHGETLVTQIRCFSGRPEGACPACGFTRSEWQAFQEQATFSCEGFAADGGARARIENPESRIPTTSPSYLCSLAADLAMVQVTRLALGLGAAVEGTFLEYCGYSHRGAVTPLAKKRDCPCDHTRHRQVRLGGPLADRTLRELAATAGLGVLTSRSPLSFLVDRFAFAEYGGCGCHVRVPLGRFVVPGQGVGRCARCGRAVVAHPFYLHRPVPASVVDSALDRPLRDLGAGAACWAAVRGDDRAVLLFERSSVAQRAGGGTL